MAKSRTGRIRPPQEMQATCHAAVQEIARERVLRQALEELDPEPDDIHLEYGELLERLSAAVVKERLRVREE